MIHFATCERSRALHYMNKFRSRDVVDSPEDAGPVLDLVEADVIRIQDPAMHPAGGIVPGENWTEDRRQEVTRTLSDWMAR